MGQAKYEYRDAGDNQDRVIYGANWACQTFTPSISHTILRVRLKLSRVGSPGTITVYIETADGAGKPSGTIRCSGTIDGNALTTAAAGAWYEIMLNGSALTASSLYAIVICAPAGNASNYVNAREEQIGGYVGGSSGDSTDSGATWTMYATLDLMFEEWGCASTSIICRIAFASTPYAAIPEWTDVSADLKALMVKRGRQHALDRMEAGEITITLKNYLNYYYPTNGASPYSPNVVPGKRLNILLVYSGAVYQIATGYITDYIPKWQTAAGLLPIMDIKASGLIANLSRLLLNDPTGYSQELSGTRVGNVLDKLSANIGRSLATGQSQMATTGTLTNINAMTHLHSVQNSELGIVFEMGDGRIAFHDRHTRLTAPYISTQATFSDTPGQKKYFTLALSESDEFIYNDVRIARSGGTEQTSADATSQTAYGTRSLSKTGLLVTADAECLAQAQYLTGRYKQPKMRVKQIGIYPTYDAANLFPVVGTLDISARIKLQLTQASIDKDYHIEGIQHTWQVDTDVWQTRWQLSDAEDQRYWVLGATGFSELGATTRLAY